MVRLTGGWTNASTPLPNSYIREFLYPRDMPHVVHCMTALAACPTGSQSPVYIPARRQTNHVCRMCPRTLDPEPVSSTRSDKHPKINLTHHNFQGQQHTIKTTSTIPPHHARALVRVSQSSLHSRNIRQPLLQWEIQRPFSNCSQRSSPSLSQFCRPLHWLYPPSFFAKTRGVMLKKASMARMRLASSILVTEGRVPCRLGLGS